ncbi:MAG: NfeD family protein [Halieaceae bacterium]|jgi:membrane protein implicated in regulation of membrane protease activity|nr:NfeD family protein [Halieaceae bacterium]
MNIHLEPWHIWTIIAVCVFIGEVFLPGFILASLGVGCLTAAGAHQFTGDLGWGIAGFAFGAGVSLILIRPYFAKALGPEQESHFGAEGMLGDVLTVTDAGDIGGHLKGHYRDTVWSLRCEEEVFEGDRVQIIAVDGGVLVVKPVPAEGD